MLREREHIIVRSRVTLADVEKYVTCVMSFAFVEMSVHWWRINKEA